MGPDEMLKQFEKCRKAGNQSTMGNLGLPPETSPFPTQNTAAFLDYALLPAIVEMEILRRKEYLTEEEAAKLYSLSAATLRTNRCRRRGPRFVKKGRKVLYKRSELDAYLERRLVIVADPADAPGI